MSLSPSSPGTEEGGEGELCPPELPPKVLLSQRGHEGDSVPWIRVLLRCSHSHVFQVLAQGRRVLSRASGTKRSLSGPGRAELKGPGSCWCQEGQVSPGRGGGGGAGPSLGTCLGCSQDLGQAHTEWEQLATPTAGLWRGGLILTMPPFSCCEEAGVLRLEGWGM